MVITTLQGGLGNQLFQYAMGLATAHRLTTSLRIDVSNYRGGPTTRLRSVFRKSGLCSQRFARAAYALDRWNIDVSVASFAEASVISLKDSILRAAKPSAPYFSRPVVRQQSHIFDPALLKPPRNCILIGFWQSEKFFSGVELKLRSDFTPRFPLSPYGEAMAADIKSVGQSVFVHVRRGDYISNEHFEVCSLDYYRNAILYMEQRLHRPRFFIFSDDPAWTIKHLAVNDRFMVVTRADPAREGSTVYDHEDLWLMAQCRHGIISNSTFSWWGAWLNAGQKGIVVAPSFWFTKPNCDSRDFIPERWVTLQP